MYFEQKYIEMCRKNVFLPIKDKMQMQPLLKPIQFQDLDLPI